jgi:hypothetical protein
MTEDEIKTTVLGLVHGRIFCASQAPPNLLGSIFLPLGLGGINGVDVKTIGNIIEDFDKAGPRSVNGYPMFLSCRLVHVDDWKVITDRALKAQAAIDAAVGDG